MQQLYGLQVDFVNVHGHFMIFSGSNGLQQQELSDFQVRMLTANRIPRLLDLQVEEKDGAASLLYNITGKRMLSHRLRTESLTLRRYYTLLLEIADVLDDSKVYMLQPGRYVLKEDFIFCGEGGLEELYFTYIPKEQLENKGSLPADLQHLASRWIHRVDQLQGSGFQELMSCLQDENFNLSELKQLLIKHLRQLVGEETIFAPKQGDSINGTLSSPPNMHYAEKLPDEPSAAVKEDDYLPISEPKEQPVRSKLFIPLLAVAGAGCLWKWYADSHSTPILFICVVLTLLLLAGAAYVLFRRPTTKATAQADDDWLAGFIEPDADKPILRPPPIPAKEPPVIKEMSTTILSREDATVRLGSKPSEDLSTEPFLEYVHNQMKERALILKNHFVIGRSAAESDFIRVEEGVSRVHAEIIKDQGGCSIRDLGSRNGTYVNGELLVPYRMQALHEGDIVKIISTEYTFKMDS